MRFIMIFFSKHTKLYRCEKQPFNKEYIVPSVDVVA